MAFDINTISLTKKIRSGLGFALLILAFTSTLSYYSIYTLIEKSKLVDHTHDVLIKIENIISHVIDAESGVRGYIITNESNYIESYEQNKRKTLSLCSQLKYLTRNNNAITAKVDTFEILLAKRYSILDVVLQLHSKNNEQNMVYIFRDGKLVMDRLKLLAANLKNTEQQLLEERFTSVRNLSGVTPFIIIFSSLVSLIIAVLSFYYINRDLARKAISQRELEALNEQLNKRNEEVTENKNELFKRNYLLSGVMEINNVMRGESDLHGLSTKILKHLCEFIKGQAGTFYIADDNSAYHLYATYGVGKTDAVPRLLIKGEGIAGQAAVERKTKVLENISAAHLKIESTLFSQDVFHTIIIPFYYDGQTVAITEIASKENFQALDLEYLEALNDSISIVINKLNSEVKTLDLLQQTQEQSRELEIRQAELRKINEELIEQQNRLITSQEELRTNEEELQEKNTELEEKANELEEQYEAVRVKNNELEEARDAIKLQIEQLQSVSKYKSEFLANMSHELRTPLNSILILSKILKDNSKKNLTSKQVEHAEVIEKSGNDLLKLINEILDLARIESGKIRLEPTFIKISDLGIEHQFTELATQRNIHFKVLLGDKIPDTIFTDRFRLEQILKNLLSNAFKFTREGGEIVLEISDPKENTKFQRSHLKSIPVIAFSIKDNGIGIPYDKQRLVFDAFQQADTSTTRKFGGTGLGLSISRELAILLGGEIQLESQENIGSNFTLYLPAQYNIEVEPKNIEIVEEIHTNAEVAEVKTSKELDLKKELQQPVSPVKTHNKTILLIDDDVYFSKIVEDYAKSKKYNVITAFTGEDGLAKAMEHNPDAILLDIKLPGISGWEVLGKIKSIEKLKNIPVHLMSALDKEEVMGENESDGFLSKPISLDTLDNAFNQIIKDIRKNLQKILVVEDNEVENNAIKELLLTQDIESETALTGKDALNLLEEKHFDCIILDINLPDITGFELLEKIKGNKKNQDLPVIIYSGKDLSEKEEARLKKYANTIIIKTDYSYTRLLEEVKLFLHNVHQNISFIKTSLPDFSKNHQLLKDKKVLVVDDDIRNIYAINNVLENEDMRIVVAYDGLQAINELKENEDVDIVLMDIMMPEMDGIEAITKIREIPKFKNLPIIALTAKAMKGDKERCIAAGASDYITKPVDIEKLLSLMRVWVYDKVNK